MLVGTGVTGAPPFTDAQLNRTELLRKLHQMVKRANNRVRATDRTAVDNALTAKGVQIDMVIDYTTFNSAAKTLEKMLQVMVDKARYVVQAYDAVNKSFSDPQRANIMPLVNEAVTAFTRISKGDQDAFIRATFALPDDTKLPEIKETFAAAATALTRLYNDRMLLCDDRGDLTIQGAGALTSPESMLLPPSFANGRTDDRVRVLLHETFHAVDTAIIDHVYSSDPSFAGLPLKDKLTNADHYAHVAREHTNLQPPQPAPVNVLGVGLVVSNQDITKVREAVAEASHRLTRAWVRALWSLQRLYRIKPGHENDWDELVLRQLSRDSQTCGLTLHHRVDGGRSDAVKPAVKPFPPIAFWDTAVLEEVVADLHTLVGWVHGQQTIQVHPAAPAVPGAAAVLTTAEVTNMHSPGLAVRLIEQAIASLRAPWLTAVATAELVNALRTRDNI
jgi:hypothetical protein